MSTLLISPDEFKDKSNVNGNVDDKIIQVAILDCQSMFVEYITGTGLLNEIISQIESSPTAPSADLTALNRTLLTDYLQPAMRKWVSHKLVRPMHYRMMNIGVQEKDSGNTSPISDRRIQNVEDDYLNDAQHYAERARRYLCENEASYPLYNNPGTGTDVIHPYRRSYKTSIYMPKRGYNNGGLESFSDEEYYR